MNPWWTAADGAELDVLVYELARGQEHHRENCRACQPGDCPEYTAWREHRAGCRGCQHEAPLTHGGPCERHADFIAHGDGCPRCNPCPHMLRAIALVVEWREARELLSRAEWLRQREPGAAA